MATINDIGTPGAPLATPPLTAWQAAVRDRLNAESAADAWLNWIPTCNGFTASASDCQYMRTRGGLVLINGTLTISAVAGSSAITLPVPNTKPAVGEATFTAGGSSYIGGQIRISTAGGTGAFLTFGTAAAYPQRAFLGPTVPGTWTAGDSINFNMFYQAAPLP